jgi:hypothetical protein
MAKPAPKWSLPPGKRHADKRRYGQVAHRAPTTVATRRGGHIWPRLSGRVSPQHGVVVRRRTTIGCRRRTSSHLLSADSRRV